MSLKLDGVDQPTLRLLVAAYVCMTSNLWHEYVAYAVCAIV